MVRETNKPDIPPELVQLCDPWLQHLWDHWRGTYIGTQIDWPTQPEREAPCQKSASVPAKVATEL